MRINRLKNNINKINNMELINMSNKIIKIIDKYDDKSFDINQIKNICSLYKNKSSKKSDSLTINEIIITSPDFKEEKINSHQINILKSKNFYNKYSFFIKILYACFKINIELFDNINGILILKNNYKLMKTLRIKKKFLITEHICILRNQHLNISKNIEAEYDEYISNYIAKIKIIDKILTYIDKLIEFNILKKTDNISSLILPYFYTYNNYIEEYN